MMDGRGAATRGAVVWFRGSVFAFAIFASPAPVAAAERAAQPAAGAWDVIKVAVDRKDQMHWLYKPDDPRLLGRELMIGAQALTFNDGSEPCRQPVFNSRQIGFAALLAESFGRPPGPGRSTKPVLADFDLPAALNKSVGALTVRCRDAVDGGSGQPWNETWFVAAAPDRLLMRIDTTALLTLSRRPPNAVPKPSFACSAATSPTELQLCGSVPLAGLDRSLAIAFKRKLDGGDVAKLR